MINQFRDRTYATPTRKSIPHQERGRRSPRSRAGLVHISVAVREALDFLQQMMEEGAEQHGDLAGPVLPEQRDASSAIDAIERLRQEAEAELDEEAAA